MLLFCISKYNPLNLRLPCCDLWFHIVSQILHGHHNCGQWLVGWVAPRYYLNRCRHSLKTIYINANSNSKVHGANMGPIWGWQDPGGPHVGPMNLAIWFRLKDMWFDLKIYLIVHKMSASLCWLCITLNDFIAWGVVYRECQFVWELEILHCLF